MSQVTFYVLDEQQDKPLFVCDMIEKAYHGGRKVYVQCDDQAQAEHIDNLLWGFKPMSFIPHNIQGEGPVPPPPVQIGFSDNANGYRDILINLSATIPLFCDRFKHIVELVDNNPETKARLRKYYRDYQSQGHTMRNKKQVATLTE